MSEYLLAKLAKSPTNPGVYLLKDPKGRVIYVGKAINLKKRLASYFSHSGHTDLKTGLLIKKVVDYETIITGSEKEALVLESNLIKRYKPRYNVILKDDKRYPSLCLHTSHPYPYLSIVRKIKSDEDIYFGPYTASGAVSQTVKLINKTFKLRKCRTREFKNRTRPCLNYQMGACLAPCCLEVDPDDYQTMVAEVTLFLSGRTADLLKKIKKEMSSAAKSEAFERAATLRDKLYSLQKTLERQVAITTDLSDRDIVAVVGEGATWAITLMAVRCGILQGVRHFVFNDIISNTGDVIRAFLKQYYEKTRFLPPEILLSELPEDVGVIGEWLSSMKGKKVSLLRPRRGEKVRLVKMASENAAKELRNTLDGEAMVDSLLKRLQKKLHMDRLPERIECIDNSNLQGQSPVSGLVVFRKGRPEPSAYRKYAIKTVAHQDDYAYMNEVLKRRFSSPPDETPYPDLLMVDGGKGQLNIALAVLKEMGLSEQIAVAGIAKKETEKGESEDKIYLPGRSNPVKLRAGGNTILFLQKIRDESHRFAVVFHRQRRTRSGLRSQLDGIPGIGAKRKKALLTHFGSVKKIRAATMNDLTAVPGMTRQAAVALIEQLDDHRQQD
jgi:excinuclease ABC subunit C